MPPPRFDSGGNGPGQFAEHVDYGCGVSVGQVKDIRIESNGVAIADISHSKAQTAGARIVRIQHGEHADVGPPVDEHVARAQEPTHEAALGVGEAVPVQRQAERRGEVGEHAPPST